MLLAWSVILRISYPSGGNTFAERYEKTMFRLELIAGASASSEFHGSASLSPSKNTEVQESLSLRTREDLYDGCT